VLLERRKVQQLIQHIVAPAMLAIERQRVNPMMKVLDFLALLSPASPLLQLHPRIRKPTGASYFQHLRRAVRRQPRLARLQ
jgi:hypothetical protein